MYDLISGASFVGSDLDVDDVLGSGHYDLIGASLAQQRYNPMARAIAQRQQAAFMQQGQQAAFQAALQAKRAQAGALLRNMNPTKARKQVLGMSSSSTIAAAASSTITARPQTFAFKPERVFIPATIGPNFTIQDIKVGNVSQLVQSGDLPAEAFSQTSFGIEMDMDTVQTSQDFIIQVTNISGGASTFRALILGRSANG
jgi:hypothetical protein